MIVRNGNEPRNGGVVLNAKAQQGLHTTVACKDLAHVPARTLDAGEVHDCPSCEHRTVG